MIQKLFCYALFLLFFSSCVTGFKMSESKIVKYYANSFSKPAFAFSDSSKKRIFYAYSADTTKPVLLLIHGAPGAWFGFKEFFCDSALLNKYQIFAPDRAGYNKSKIALTSIEQQANSLKFLLKKHNNEKVSILGRSYGAAIAAKLTAENPELVENLILISPACDPRTEKFWWFSKFGNTKFMRFLLPKYANLASDEKFTHIEELERLIPDWQKIKCPVTIFQGGKDWIIDNSSGHFVDSSLVNAPRRFIILPQNGHLITLERHDLLREILLER
jgi:pimeloyl-ACP methyl ester carboxylesterase